MIKSDDPYKIMFEAAGYEVSWDSLKGVFWYAVSDSKGLVFQLDMGVLMEDFLEDCVSYLQGKSEGTSKSNYLCNVEDIGKFRKMMRKIMVDK